ncbi:MAG: hypothetical protein E6J41_08005 [Chloroflexi bacterium]|nr:MAG: hypothetical protein E6J41_08005 [Chloroflexota bacterium]
MNRLERLLEWAPYATPRERWRMERDLDGFGVPFTVDEQGHEQRGIVSIDLPTGEDVEWLWALIEAGPDLLKVAQAAQAQLGCLLVHGGKPKGWTCLDTVREAHDPAARMADEYRAKVLALGYACDHCKLGAALAPLLGEEAR